MLDVPSEVISGEQWIARFGLGQITSPVQAQDLIIHYNPDRFAFVAAESKLESLKIVQMKDDVPGQLRLIAVSTGLDQAIRTDGLFFELTMLAKDVDTAATGTIEIVQAIVSDPAGTESNARLVSKNITIKPIGIPADVNNDGKVSVGDLAMAAVHYGKTADSPDWNEAKIVDINKDNKIDVIDLMMIARELLNV